MSSSSHLHPLTPARPSKRRRLTPTQYPTSQAHLTPLELHALLPRIDTTPLAPTHLQLPRGTMPEPWIIRTLYRQRTLSQEIIDTLPGSLPLLLYPPLEIPSEVGPHSRLPGLRRRVSTFRLTRGATPSETTAAVKTLLPPDDGGQLLFRGDEFAARGWFAPSVVSSTEFGAGVGTTTDLEYAVHLAGVVGMGVGVVFVFSVPDVQGLTVWTLEGKEWEDVVCREHGITRRGRGGRMKRRKGEADVVVGAVSRDCWEARKEGRVVRPDEAGKVLCVWRSGEACRRLEESLVAAVFLEDP